ncbi:MAG: hypothetical protein IPO70_14945 [Bacteroidetes bacterium]|nr:hypothetical protein [Bacteroidota bacterium]
MFIETSVIHDDTGRYPRDDGETQDSFVFLSPIKETVITADNKNKKYGEKYQDYTSTITVDGVALASSGLTLSDLGLTNISYSSSANSQSVVSCII